MKTKIILFSLILLSAFNCHAKENRYSIILRDIQPPKGFDKRNYSEKEQIEIQEMLKNIKMAFENLKIKAEPEIISKNLSLEIIFDKRDWTKNVRINIHDQFTSGFETIGPARIINDAKLKIDYYWFYGKNCPLKWTLVEGIIYKVYNDLLNQQ